MKKKLETLMQNSALVDNETFKKLFKDYQTAKKALEKAKNARAKAKLAYRDFEAESDKKTAEKAMTLHTALLQAKSMQQFHRAGFELAKFRLNQWLRNWRKETAGASASVSETPQEEGSTTKKTKTPAMARKKAPKAAPKLDAQ